MYCVGYNTVTALSYHFFRIQFRYANLVFFGWRIYSTDYVFVYTRAMHPTYIQCVAVEIFVA